VGDPDAFVSVVDPTTGGCTGGISVSNCQFGDAGRNTVRGPHFTDLGHLPDQEISSYGKGHRCGLIRRCSMLSNHPNFALPSSVEAWSPGRLYSGEVRYARSTISPPTGIAWRGAGRRQLAARDCFSSADRVLVWEQVADSLRVRVFWANVNVPWARASR